MLVNAIQGVVVILKWFALKKAPSTKLVLLWLE
jgi:hypothetical protein